MTPKILAFAGSLRRASYNKMLVSVAAQGAREAGAEVTLIDLAEFPMPIYDGDIESASGIPDSALKLKKLMKGHQGFLISAPEYNSSISAALKNVIDWTSRPMEGESNLECYAGKVIGLMAVSPGALGGLRGLFHVRDIFLNINSIVLPNQYALSGANDAFDDQGSLKDAGTRTKVHSIAARVVDTVRKLHA